MSNNKKTTDARSLEDLEEELKNCQDVHETLKASDKNVSQERMHGLTHTSIPLAKANKSLQSGVNYLENQNTQLIEKNKVQEATINFYKGLLNRTIESYASEICQTKEEEDE